MPTPAREHSRQDQAGCAEHFVVQAPQTESALTDTRTLLQHVEFFARVEHVDRLGERCLEGRQLLQPVWSPGPTLQLRCHQWPLFHGHRLESPGTGGMADGCQEFRRLRDAVVLAQ